MYMHIHTSVHLPTIVLILVILNLIFFGVLIRRHSQQLYFLDFLINLERPRKKFYELHPHYFSQDRKIFQNKLRDCLLKVPIHIYLRIPMVGVCVLVRLLMGQ